MSLGFLPLGAGSFGEHASLFSVGLLIPKGGIHENPALVPRPRRRGRPRRLEGRRLSYNRSVIGRPTQRTYSQTIPSLSRSFM